jgi:hypothetical protein
LIFFSILKDRKYFTIVTSEAGGFATLLKTKVGGNGKCIEYGKIRCIDKSGPTSIFLGEDNIKTEVGGNWGNASNVEKFDAWTYPTMDTSNIMIVYSSLFNLLKFHTE